LDAATRLRALYRVVVTLREHYGPETIRAFVTGANPDLSDRAPLDVIRDGHGTDAVHAAEAFLD
jgi:hypothetical protein